MQLEPTWLLLNKVLMVRFCLVTYSMYIGNQGSQYVSEKDHLYTVIKLRTLVAYVIVFQPH